MCIMGYAFVTIVKSFIEASVANYILLLSITYVLSFCVLYPAMQVPCCDGAHQTRSFQMALFP